MRTMTIVVARPPKRSRKPKPPGPAVAQRIVTLRKRLPKGIDDPEEDAAVKVLVQRMMRPPAE